MIRFDKPNARDIDFATLERVAEYGGAVLCGGILIPVCRPRATWSDPVAFDKAVCRAGLLHFVRPGRAGEWPSGTRPAPWTRVEELTPGVRRRTDARLALPPGHPASDWVLDPEHN